MTAFFMVLIIHGHAYAYNPVPYKDLNLCESDSEFFMDRHHFDSSRGIYTECKLFSNYHVI